MTVGLHHVLVSTGRINVSSSSASAPRTLEHVTSVCGNGSCPTVYKTDRGTLVIQGYAVAGGQVGVELPAGEMLVEIPVDLIKGAIESL